jgi:TolA-binding protein
MSPGSPLAGRAFLARGWCFWLAGKYPESLADFASAAQRLPLSQELAVARFKMGDAQFALKDFAGAQTNYSTIFDDFRSFPEVADSLGGRALYQILRARLALRDAAGLDDPMRRLLEKFFTAAPVDSSLLLAGEGFSDFGSPARAREVFENFESQHADSPLMPQVAFAVARTYEREQNWPAAVTNEQAWLETYSTNELRPQVEYARAWAVSQTGNEAGSFELFNKFISQFPANPLAPLAHWWVADHYFRLGGTNFWTAELNYETIFQDFPTNELAYPAQLMAGRAAMGRFSYTDASRYFRELISTNCPEDLRDQARFAYCEALLRQITSADTNNANLQDVTSILAQMTPKAATNIVGALAWSETALCDLQLGALDAATNDYAQVLNSPAASAELRDRAYVGLGIVLEKKAESLPDDARKALLNLAMDNYGKAFYSDDETKDAFWTKKAGLQMLALNAKAGILKGSDLDAFITKLERLFPQLQDSLEQKRLAAKN